MGPTTAHPPGSVVPHAPQTFPLDAPAPREVYAFLRPDTSPPSRLPGCRTGPGPNGFSRGLLCSRSRRVVAALAIGVAAAQCRTPRHSSCRPRGGISPPSGCRPTRPSERRDIFVARSISRFSWALLVGRLRGAEHVPRTSGGGVERMGARLHGCGQAGGDGAASCGAGQACRMSRIACAGSRTSRLIAGDAPASIRAYPPTTARGATLKLGR